MTTQSILPQMSMSYVAQESTKSPCYPMKFREAQESIHVSRL